MNSTYNKDPVAFVNSWLKAHIKNSEDLGKPFVVEEFGKNLPTRDAGTIAKLRDPVFTAVYNTLADNIKSGGAFRGESNQQ